MTEHLEAAYPERTPYRRGERDGHYTRRLITPIGKIEQLPVTPDREGTFFTEGFERYKGNIETRGFSHLLKESLSCPSGDIKVPGGGIEPPTRGFSVRCSTD